MPSKSAFWEAGSEWKICPTSGRFCWWATPSNSARQTLENRAYGDLDVQVQTQKMWCRLEGCQPGCDFWHRCPRIKTKCLWNLRQYTLQPPLSSDRTIKYAVELPNRSLVSACEAFTISHRNGHQVSAGIYRFSRKNTGLGIMSKTQFEKLS